VAINNRDAAWSATFATGLPAGSYCNVIEGPSIAGICSGTAYVTSSSTYALLCNVFGFFCRFSVGYGGSLSVTIDPRQAIAVHTGAMGAGVPVPMPQQVSVLFSESATTTYGEVSGERLWLWLTVSESQWR
jgi:hypothetical protein